MPNQRPPYDKVQLAVLIVMVVAVLYFIAQFVRWAILL